jgi:hypothetical protein
MIYQLLLHFDFLILATAVRQSTCIHHHTCTIRDMTLLAGIATIYYGIRFLPPIYGAVLPMCSGLSYHCALGCPTRHHVEAPRKHQHSSYTAYLHHLLKLVCEADRETASTIQGDELVVCFGVFAIIT